MSLNYDICPDPQDWDDYEAEQERIHRMHKRQAAELEAAEMEEESERENY